MILVYHIIGLVYYESCNVTPWHFAKSLYKSFRCFPFSVTLSCLSVVHLQGESDNRNFGSADHEIKFIGYDVAYRDPRACAMIAYLIQLWLDLILSCHVSVPTQSCSLPPASMGHIHSLLIVLPIFLSVPSFSQNPGSFEALPRSCHLK